MKVCSLFGGIGGFDLGFQRALGKENVEVVFYNDIDKYAVQTYNKNFGTSYEATDITTVKASDIPEFDILCGGFPCQSFSVAGKRRGFEDTRGTMFFEIARILKAKRPFFVFLENVKGLLNHDKGKTFSVIIQTLEELGYSTQWMVLNSKFFGVPQNRERVFIIGSIGTDSGLEILPFREDAAEIQGISGEEKVHPRLDANYYKGMSNQRKVLAIKKIGNVYEKGGQAGEVFDRTGGIPVPLVARALRARDRSPPSPKYHYDKGEFNLFFQLTERRTDEAKRIRKEKMKKGRDWSPRRGKVLEPREDNQANCVTAGQSKERLLFDTHNLRRLTPIECERLQGFPDNWTAGVSDTQRYKQLGNAVTVNVIEAIVRRIKEPFRSDVIQ